MHVIGCKNVNIILSPEIELYNQLNQKEAGFCLGSHFSTCDNKNSLNFLFFPPKSIL